MSSLGEIFTSGLIALVAALVGGFFALYIESWRASRRHAREANPAYFRDVYLKTVSLRDAIHNLGEVYNKHPDAHNLLIIDLIKIVIARIEDYNRALSPSTNPDVFLLPSFIERDCIEVRGALNLAVYETQFGVDTRLFSIQSIQAAKESGTPLHAEIERLPRRNPAGVRYFEGRTKQVVKSSDFFDSGFRARIQSRLNSIIGQLKSLSVD